MSTSLSVIAYVPKNNHGDVRQLIMDIFRRLSLEPRYAGTVSFGFLEIPCNECDSDPLIDQIDPQDLPKIVIYRSGGSSVFEIENIEFQKIKVAIDLALEQ